MAIGRLKRRPHRRIARAALALLLLFAASLPESYAAGPIDLDAPGSLEAIKHDRLQHYMKIQRILAEAPWFLSDASWLPEGGPRLARNDVVAKWLRQFEARDVRHADIILASLPPKKRLQFSLDNVSYVTTVTLSGYGPRPMPAQRRAPGR